MFLHLSTNSTSSIDPLISTPSTSTDASINKSPGLSLNSAIHDIESGTHIVEGSSFTINNGSGPLLSSSQTSICEIPSPVQSDLARAAVPDGGVKAWTTIFGAWLILFATFGYLYSFGIFQDFYTRVLLSHHSPGKIAWIGSTQLMMPFFLGAVSGKLFDVGYFHALEIYGAVIFTVSLFMLSLVKPQQFYQVFLSQGLGLGLGLGLTFVPTASIAVHHFKKRKALATGVALTGGAIGSVVFPIMINHLMPSVGFEKAVQSSAYVVMGCLIVGNVLVKTSYPDKSVSEKAQKPDIKSFFSDPPYLWTLLGAIPANLGVFFPVIYLQLYAMQHNIDPNLSFYSLSIVNGMGAVGRVSGNFLADKYGSFNIFIPCTAINAALIFAVFGVTTRASLIAFSVIFGLTSGAWLSLSISALGTLSRRPDEVGARTGIALAVSSFGALGAAPAQGALLTSEFLWHKPIIFSGVVLGASSVCILVTRTLLVRERGTQRV